ncbi:MAG: sporulation protein YabP [Ruminococcus sp.]|nr:sporulation protein YabP [Ruminococcus sp.]
MNDIQGSHNAILENRRKLMLTGVTDVESFNEEQINLYTQLGELTIKGNQLHINEMSVDSGDLSVEGDISALIYGDRDRRNRLTTLGKLFR